MQLQWDFSRNRTLLGKVESFMDNANKKSSKFIYFLFFIKFFSLKFLVHLHGEYNTNLALWKHHENLLLQSFRSVGN